MARSKRKLARILPFFLGQVAPDDQGIALLWFRGRGQALAFLTLVR
jgi:hypothetical protein